MLLMSMTALGPSLLIALGAGVVCHEPPGYPQR